MNEKENKNEDKFKINLSSIDPYISHRARESQWLTNCRSTLIKRFRVKIHHSEYFGDVVVMFHRSDREYTYPNVPGEYICGLIRAYAKDESVGKYFKANIERYSTKRTS